MLDIANSVSQICFPCLHSVGLKWILRIYFHVFLLFGITYILWPAMDMCGYVDVMWPFIQVSEHLHYVGRIPCQGILTFPLTHTFCDICTFLWYTYFDKHALQCSRSDTLYLHRGIKTWKYFSFCLGAKWDSFRVNLCVLNIKHDLESSFDFIVSHSSSQTISVFKEVAGLTRVLRK